MPLAPTTAPPSENAETEFRALVGELRRAQSGRRQHPDGKRQRRARRTSAEAGIAWLRSEVVPLMLAAWNALGEFGIGVDIEEEFDLPDRPGFLPNVSFQCVGPVEDNPFGRPERPRSDRFFFVCDGVSLQIAIARHYAQNRQFRPLGNPVPLGSGAVRESVRQALADAVRSYFEILARP
jgi:hypothetical protein